ncbi:MAG TPA: LysR family transcriptional regulator [archaeon]|nr:LysR family transcriptional regulator [archaeon]
MHLEQLRFFQAVAEKGSFTRAAEELLLTQPAVSNQILKLEDDLGQKLFERQGKRVQLTRAGEILYAHSRKIFQQLREVEGILEDLKSLDTGTLTLGTIDVISIYVLPRIFSQFHQRYPRVEISIDIDDSTNICAGVLDGRFDLGFATLPVENKNLISIPIYTDILQVIAPRGHPLTRQKLVSLADLMKTTLIVYKKGSVTRKIIEGVFERRGLKLDPDMEIDRPEAMKKLVEAGLGLSIIPEMTIKRELEEGTLLALPTGDVHFKRRLGLVYRKGQFFSPSTTAFLEILHSTFKPARWIGTGTSNE